MFFLQMDTLGIEATPEEVDLMIDEIDQDNNGEIDFEGDKAATFVIHINSALSRCVLVQSTVLVVVYRYYYYSCFLN